MAEVAVDLQRRLDHINLKDIDVGVRFRRNYGDLRELAADIRERGVLQPIAVLEKSFANMEELEGQLDESKPYLLMAGGRRTYASKAAKLDEIPALIFQHEVDELELRIVELHENIKRKAMDHVEEVESKRRIHELMQAKFGEKTNITRGDGAGEGWGVTDTARMLGESAGGVSQDIKLARAMEEYPELKTAKNKAEAQKRLQNIIKDKAKAELAKRAHDKVAETPLDIARQNLCKRYRVGDFFEGARVIPDRTVDFYEIDPPYAKDLVTLIGEDRDTARNYVEVEAEDDRPMVDTYHDFMSKVFDEAYRTMKDHSWGICWYAMDPWHRYIYDWLMDAGFTVRGVPNIWDKVEFGGKTNNANFNLAGCYENYFYFRKGTPKLAKPGSPNVHRMRPPSQSQRTHPAERPIELIEDILEMFLSGQGKNVIVPFAGSGNTLLACENLRHNSVGWDISNQYKADFDFKVLNGEPGKYKTFS